MIGRVIQSPTILRENVYNMDETGVMLSMLGSVKVLVGKDDLRDHRGADIRSLLPLIIWPASTHRSNWTTYPTPWWHNPSHTSHKLQPCDVGLFAPLKTAYRDEVERLYRGGLDTVGKEHFTFLYEPARERTITKRKHHGWMGRNWFVSVRYWSCSCDGLLEERPQMLSALYKYNALHMTVDIQEHLGSSE